MGKNSKGIRKLLGIVVAIAILLTMIPTMSLAQENAAAASTQFSDVKPADWFYGTVNFLVSKGVIGGYPDGTFKPKATVQVDAFIKMVVTALGFTDIQNSTGYWATNYINKAKELKLVLDSEFTSYTRQATRGEMARMVVRALVAENYPADLSSYTGQIKDYGKIQSDLKEYIVKAFYKGIITGYPDGEFKDSLNATRSEAATMIARLIDPSLRIAPTLPSVTTKLAPVDDAAVALSKPADVLGAQDTIGVTGGQYEKDGLLKFNLKNIHGTIKSAKIMLYFTGSGGTVTGNTVIWENRDNNWTESSVTWENRPEKTAIVTTYTNPTKFPAWFEIDLSSYIKGNDIYSFTFVSDCSVRTTFATKENVTEDIRPYLEVVYLPDSASAPTAIPTVTPTPIPTATPTATPVPTATPTPEPTSTPTPVAVVSTAIFNPTADAEVRVGKPANNYSAQAVVSTSAETAFLREGFIKFDVTGITGNVKSVKLKLYHVSNNPIYDAASTTQVWGNQDTAWTETGLNWNNQPVNTTKLAEYTNPLETGKWIEVDIPVSYVNGNGTYSFNLISTATVGRMDYSTKEATDASQIPQLVVEYE